MTTKEKWIIIGYEAFALLGENGLKIEMLAQKMSISKSSFYHYFADISYFTEFLLKHHLEQSRIIAAKERNVENIKPQLIDILVEHKIDLLFNRQLRFNQQNVAYQTTLRQSNQIIGNEFVKIWAKDLQLALNIAQLEGLFELALENFFLQINPDNLNFEWLAAYFDNLKRIAKTFV